jgi:hypothetical protein
MAKRPTKKTQATWMNDPADDLAALHRKRRMVDEWWAAQSEDSILRARLQQLSQRIAARIAEELQHQPAVGGVH